jgi:prepilin-type N-terminal cleavage/methylation domain-containing protein
MKRFAFTMIELVFVIVVLGILAAVAIPRLVATRDDAVNVTISQNIMIGAAEIAAYAVAKGETNESLAVMSNAIESLVNSGKAHLDTVEKSAYIHRGSVNDCVIMDINTSVTDENLTLSFGNAGGDSFCVQLQSLLDINRYPMKIRGVSVEQ